MKVNNTYVTIDPVTAKITMLYECWGVGFAPTRWFVFYVGYDGAAFSREITDTDAREIIASTPKQ